MSVGEILESPLCPCVIVLHLSLRSSTGFPAPAQLWEMAFQDRALALFCFAGNCAEYVITFQEFSFYLPKYHLLPQVEWRLWGGESLDIFPWKSFTCWSDIHWLSGCFCCSYHCFQGMKHCSKPKITWVFFQFLRTSLFVLSSATCSHPSPAAQGNINVLSQVKLPQNFYRWFCSCQYFCFLWPYGQCYKIGYFWSLTVQNHLFPDTPNIKSFLGKLKLQH